jgi:hypothetical protein
LPKAQIYDVAFLQKKENANAVIYELVNLLILRIAIFIICCFFRNFMFFGLIVYDKDGLTLIMLQEN